MFWNYPIITKELYLEISDFSRINLSFYTERRKDYIFICSIDLSFFHSELNIVSSVLAKSPVFTQIAIS